MPFHILKPVLQLASPDQLFSLENYNPYLIDDTDDLWRHHCNRKFRSQKLRDMETWRDMFLVSDTTIFEFFSFTNRFFFLHNLQRCTDEQNARLSHLTENIKASQAIAVPVKKTKIAFVDSMVKPPRNVLKKQVSEPFGFFLLFFRLSTKRIVHKVGSVLKRTNHFH